MSSKFLKIYILQIACPPTKKNKPFFFNLLFEKLELALYLGLLLFQNTVLNGHLESKRVPLKSLLNHFSPDPQGFQSLMLLDWTTSVAVIIAGVADTLVLLAHSSPA